MNMKKITGLLLGSYLLVGGLGMAAAQETAAAAQSALNCPRVRQTG